MSRILLAWELGSNYGHLAKLIPLTRALRKKGHAVALAVKNISAFQPFLGRSEATFLQAPHDEPFATRRQPASSADILDDHGFGSHERLEGLVRGWDGLYSLFRPDVVVAEYALSAVFTARLAGIPCLRVDSGFAIPPEVSPYPCFRPWLKLQRHQLLEKETAILLAVNRVCSEYSHAPFEHLFQAVRADLTLLACFPELDHYPGRTGGRYIGPLSNLETGHEIPWPPGTGPRIFAYLRPSPKLDKILTGLKDCGGQVIAVVPGIGHEQSDLFANGSLVVTDQPAKLPRILSEADLVISHATPGLTTSALLAGVPTLGVPTQIEQMMFAAAIERLGVGQGFSYNTVNASFHDALQKALSNKDMSHRARLFADKYSGYDEQVTLARLVKTIERLPEATKRSGKAHRSNKNDD